MHEFDTANKCEEAHVAAYRRYCNQIDKEDEMIDKRVNWLLTSQSILFAAVGLGGNGAAEVALSVVPWAGLFLSFTIGITVLAASSSLRLYRKRLKEVYPPRSDQKKYYPQLHRNRSILKLGLVPSSIVPLIFSAAWIAVILMQNAPAD